MKSSPEIGEGTVIMAGVVINADTHIGIGACAVIIRDVPDGATVIGNPGRVINHPKK